MKKQKNYNSNIVFIIPAIAIIIGALAFIITFHFLNPANTVKDGVGDGLSSSVTPVLENSSSVPADSYVGETNYKGELSQFPDLYEYPFKKSDAYICNKDFSKEHSDIFEECRSDATQFMEALFNIDYREIVKDKNNFDANVMRNCDYTAYVTTGWDTEEEKTEYLYEHVQDITDYFAKNMVEMEAKFYTDDSLIYSDFYTFVRGELVFTIYSSQDSESEFEIGKEYSIPMEIAMQRSPNSSSDRIICSFGRAYDDKFFLNP